MPISKTASNASISTTWTQLEDASSDHHLQTSLALTIHIPTPPHPLTTQITALSTTQLLSQQTITAKYRTKDHAQHANLATYSTPSTSPAYQSPNNAPPIILLMEPVSPAYLTTSSSMAGASLAPIPLTLPALYQLSTISARPVRTATSSTEAHAKPSILSAKPAKSSEEPASHATQATSSSMATASAFRSSLLVRPTISTRSALLATTDFICLLESVCLLVLYVSTITHLQDNASIASQATACLR